LYSGRLNTLLDEVDECMRLAMQCRLPSLKDRLDEARKRSIAFGKLRISKIVIFINSPVRSFRSGGLAAVICAIFYLYEGESTELADILSMSS